MKTDCRPATLVEGENEVRAFVGGRCEKSGKATSAELYGAYRDWATAELSVQPISDRLFGLAITNLGFGKVKSERGTVRTGISLRALGVQPSLPQARDKYVRLVDEKGNPIESPEGLDPHELLVWKYGVDELAINDPARLALLYKGCRLLQQANESSRQLDKAGYTFTKASGDLIEHPLVGVVAKLSAQASKCFVELGLNMCPDPGDSE